MVDIDVRTRRAAEEQTAAINRVTEPMPPRIAFRRRLRIFPLLITLATVAVAVGLGQAMWDAYMGAPWTRDGTVRVYVVTMAPEVAGRIVELPVKDNQFVHKGDLLMVIDPTDYKIAVSLDEAAVQEMASSALWPITWGATLQAPVAGSVDEASVRALSSTSSPCCSVEPWRNTTLR